MQFRMGWFTVVRWTNFSVVHLLQFRIISKRWVTGPRKLTTAYNLNVNIAHWKMLLQFTYKVSVLCVNCWIPANHSQTTRHWRWRRRVTFKLRSLLERDRRALQVRNVDKIFGILAEIKKAEAFVHDVRVVVEGARVVRHEVALEELRLDLLDSCKMNEKKNNARIQCERDTWNHRDAGSSQSKDAGELLKLLKRDRNFM